MFINFIFIIILQHVITPLLHIHYYCFTPVSLLSSNISYISYFLIILLYIVVLLSYTHYTPATTLCTRIFIILIYLLFPHYIAIYFITPLINTLQSCSSAIYCIIQSGHFSPSLCYEYSKEEHTHYKHWVINITAHYTLQVQPIHFQQYLFPALCQAVFTT